MMSKPLDPAPGRPTTRLVNLWRPQWLIPLVTVGLGGVVFAAEASDDDLGSGLVWLGVFLVLGAVLAFGGRFEQVRLARGDSEDERDWLINTQAMAATGTAMVIGLTGCVVFTLARGDDTSPYIQLLAAAGVIYGAALLLLRWRS